MWFISAKAGFIIKRLAENAITTAFIWYGLIFSFKKIKEKILSSKEIHYIGDGITNSELIFSGKEFFKVLEFLFENVPEHHYFFDEDKRWCLLIATEGWITYGEKSNKNNI